MPYDIFGNNLRSGHCEVHPWVHESYPCSVCHQEAAKEERLKREEERYYRELEQRDYERDASESHRGTAGDGI